MHSVSVSAKKEKKKKERGTNNKLNSVAFACQTVEFGCFWMPFRCVQSDFSSKSVKFELNSVAFTPNATESSQKQPNRGICPTTFHVIFKIKQILRFQLRVDDNLPHCGFL